MEGALAEFKETAGYPQEVAPELSIECHDSAEEFRGRLFVSSEVINLSSAVVDKANHR
jgi:hypothetical protein